MFTSLIDGLAAFINGECVSWTALRVTPAELLDACDTEGLTGLVHARLRAGAGESWPEDVQQELASRARVAAAEEVLRRRAATSALDALGAAGVRPVLLKGTAVAYGVYAAPSFRPRADTDLLIPRDQVAAAREVMTTLGYEASPNSGGERLFAQFQFWMHDRYGVQHVFDFHWKISTQPTFAQVLTYDELAAEAVPIAALGGQARAAGRVHALLLACIHPAMHHRNAEHLLWMYDIYLLASTFSDADFDRFIKIAAVKRVGAICAHELDRARARFTFRLPAAATAARAEWRDEPSAAYLRPHRRWVDDMIASMRGLPRWSDRVGFLREIVFPSPEYMQALYGIKARSSAAVLPVLYTHRILKGIEKIARGRK